MSGAHAKYSGSNAHRFLRCPGQPRLAAQVPELPDGPDAVYRLEGDKAHDLLGRQLHGVSDVLSRSPRGSVDRNPQEIVPAEDAADMVEAVRAVVEYLDVLRAQHPDLVIHSELPITFPQNVVPAENVAGTADVVAFSPAQQKVWIIDFKYGIGETVEAYDNAQIKFYATGAVWRTAFRELYGVIIQPRSFRGAEPRVSQLTASDIVDFQSTIVEAILVAENPAAPLVPGEWCHFCPAGAICPAREATAMAVVSPDGRPLRALDPLALPDPADLSMERIGLILDMKDQVTKWLNDVSKYAFLQAMAGEHIAGQKLVEAAARRKWRQDMTVADLAKSIHDASGSRIKMTDLFETALIALTEAEKLVVAAFKDQGQTAAAAKEWFAQLVKKESSGELTLAPLSDKRPAADRVKNDFAGVVPAQIGGQ